MLLAFKKKRHTPNKQSKISHDESKIVPSNNNNQTSITDKFSLKKVVTSILNTITVNVTTIKDAGIPAKININIRKTNIHHT